MQLQSVALHLEIVVVEDALANDVCARGHVGLLPLAELGAKA